MKILIVDDESLAIERLYILLKELYPEIKIMTANNGLIAIEKLSEEKYDIILLDIRMPCMDGIEVANHIASLKNPPAIIFTTAYQEHAIRAFDANAVDYVLKPIRKKRLKLAIERAKIICQSQLLMLSKDKTLTKKRTHVSSLINNSLKLVAIDDIYYLKAEQKYVNAVWPTGELLLNESLVSLETDFTNLFVRIHRNTLVAKKRIKGLKKTSDGQIMIQLTDMSIELPISRRHLTKVKASINKITKHH